MWCECMQNSHRLVLLMVLLLFLQVMQEVLFHDESKPENPA